MPQRTPPCLRLEGHNLAVHDRVSNWGHASHMPERMTLPRLTGPRPPTTIDCIGLNATTPWPGCRNMTSYNSDAGVYWDGAESTLESVLLLVQICLASWVCGTDMRKPFCGVCKPCNCMVSLMFRRRP